MAPKKNTRLIRTRNGIPLTRDEYRQLKKQKEREDRRRRQEAWEAARGPMDLPFLLLDVVVASTLMSMGMVMLPPAMISTPFKLLLFVTVDGWNLLFSSLVQSVN